MYGYPYYPPPWGAPYPPPNVNGGDTPIAQKHFERGMKVAMRLAEREKRDEERKKRFKAKSEEDARKRAAKAWSSTFTFIELYILGVITAPFAGQLYQWALHH